MGLSRGKEKLKLKIGGREGVGDVAGLILAGLHRGHQEVGKKSIPQGDGEGVRENCTA